MIFFFQPRLIRLWAEKNDIFHSGSERHCGGEVMYGLGTSGQILHQALYYEKKYQKWFCGPWKITGPSLDLRCIRFHNIWWSKGQQMQQSQCCFTPLTRSHNHTHRDDFNTMTLDLMIYSWAWTSQSWYTHAFGSHLYYYLFYYYCACLFIEE